MWEGGAYCGAPPVPDGLFLRWNFDPVVLALLGVLALTLRRSGAGLSATAILAFVLISPLCALSSALFSARVVHHVLMVSVAAPLLALACPARASGSAALTFLVSTAALWLWHLPLAYDAALSNVGLYWLMQASLLCSAFVFWRAVLLLPGAAGAGWVFLSFLQMAMPGAILTLAPRVLYEAHASAPLLWGIAPLADQQLGGLVMWMPAGLPYAIFGALLARKAWRAAGGAG